MIISTERPDRTWWALTRGNLAAHWPQLLGVQALFAAAGLAVWVLRAGLESADLFLAGSVWSAVADGLLAAWSWSTVLRILDGGHRVGSALRPDLRRTARLWGWLVALGGLDQLGLLSLLGPGVYGDLVLSHAMAVFQLAALYLSFATALLPMTVVLEGRGLRAAWRLSHGSWRTALQIVAALVVGGVLAELAELPQAAALSSYPYPVYLPLLQAAGLVLTTFGRVLTAPMLHAAFRLRRPVRTPAADEPALI
ncbi:hypothetical protein ACFW1A_09595 [Kitasatospora sp. NPDC058965]|uniref:hypothetical protein n=1 Tax=Kitasatospora sp. NPDC058965 TaxID=3346682 RepID=UPI0036989C2E